MPTLFPDIWPHDQSLARALALPFPRGLQLWPCGRHWPSFLFLSPARNQRDDYPNFLAQLATTRAVLSVLASIATGTRPALPPGATEKDGFVELLEADGLKIRLRR